MRSKYATYLLFLLGFFLLISIFRGWVDLNYLVFWIGGLLGVYLPDIDQLVYVYLLRPHELSSQRATKMIGKGQVKEAASFLRGTTTERKKLIFHSALFQLVFAAFAFLVTSSSGSMLGNGLVLGFLLHILVDELSDLMEYDNLDLWMGNLSIDLNKQQATVYWFSNLIFLIILGFVF
jgi:hypothetical protein